MSKGVCGGIYKIGRMEITLLKRKVILAPNGLWKAN